MYEFIFVNKKIGFFFDAGKNWIKNNRRPLSDGERFLSAHGG